jgi:putative isomerase
MAGHVTIPLARAWNSWSPRPAELTFLPLGLRITPVLYSTRARRTSLIEPRCDTVRFGRHSIDNSLIEVETKLAGTSLSFQSGATDPFSVRGQWTASTLGEWGTRFWLTLAISANGGEAGRYDEAKAATIIKIDRRFAAIVTRAPPIQVTGHDTIEALCADFEANGYFYTATRSNVAPVLGLRFNMEMMREGAYAVAIADSEELAIANARASLDASTIGGLSQHRGRYAGALDAVRDVVGWNTIWDPVNHRPYTAVTRIWNLGEFAVWYNDQTFAALLSGVFDSELARANIATALAGATPQGNIACIVTSNDAWVDRSQPPHGGLVTWLLYLRSGERSIVEVSYEALARNQRWWRANRDPDGFGLISCGTSDVGEGLYKGTVFGARNETGMDNSATHDEAEYDPVTRTLSTYDLGLNCALALDAEMLSNMAALLGKSGEATEFADLAERSRTLIHSHLWDGERGVFANRQRKGGFVHSLSPTSFYPLLCGAASPEQAFRLLEHLDDPSTFGGDFVIPNATRDDTAFAENVYWRGRIWPNVNYMVWLGLKRYGFGPQAARLAEQGFDLFMQSWQEQRIAAENYNAVTGAAMDQGDTDPFYIWAALLPLMAVEQICGFDPWAGWSLSNSGSDVEVGPFLSPVGPITVRIENSILTLMRGDAPLFSTDMVGRITELALNDGYMACRLESQAGENSTIHLTSIAAPDIVAVTLDDQPGQWTARGIGTDISLPASMEGVKLQVWYRGRLTSTAVFDLHAAPA